MVQAARAVLDRTGRLAGQVRALPARALDNALEGAQALGAAVAVRRALAPVHDPGPGGLEPLPAEHCLDLLATRTVGRLAYVARAGVPDVAPVNYVLDGRDVLLRSGPGPKLQAAERRDLVAFEVDDIDERSHTGWSVVLVGRARRLSPAERARLSTLPAPWAAGPRDEVVRITAVRITGRRLR